MIPIDSEFLSTPNPPVRSSSEVDCEHAHECFNGGFYGKGCYEDLKNSEMGGKPWKDCYCMRPHERPQ